MWSPFGFGRFGFGRYIVYLPVCQCNTDPSQVNHITETNSFLGLYRHECNGFKTTYMTRGTLHTFGSYYSLPFWTIFIAFNFGQLWIISGQKRKYSGLICLRTPYTPGSPFQWLEPSYLLLKSTFYPCTTNTSLFWPKCQNGNVTDRIFDRISPNDASHKILRFSTIGSRSLYNWTKTVDYSFHFSANSDYSGPGRLIGPGASNGSYDTPGIHFSGRNRRFLPVNR